MDHRRSEYERKQCNINNSKLLSRRTKIKLYKTLFKPIVLYACMAYVSTKTDDKILIIFERKIFINFFDPKKNIAINKYERRTNTKLKEIFNEPDTIII